MAVEAVNGANQQERQHSVGTAIGTGVATGVIGAGATYLATGGRNIPSLEKVFEQEPDKFESTMKKVKDAGKDEAEIGKVRTAYTTFNSAIEAQKTAYNTAKSDIDANIKTMVDAEGETTIKDANEKVTNAKSKEVEVKTFNESGEVIKDAEGKEVTKKIHVLEMRNEVEALEKDVNDPAKAADKAKNEAKLKALNAEYKSEIDALKAEEKALLEAQTARFEKLAESDGPQKELKKALADAESKLNTAKSEAMGKVSEEAKTAFGKIKGALKDIKWSKIGLWGGIAAVAGLILGYMLSSKPVEAPQEAQA